MIFSFNEIKHNIQNAFLVFGKELTMRIYLFDANNLLTVATITLKGINYLFIIMFFTWNLMILLIVE